MGSALVDYGQRTVLLWAAHPATMGIWVLLWAAPSLTPVFAGLLTLALPIVAGGATMGICL